MKRYNNLSVIDIDHGYGNNKTANTVKDFEFSYFDDIDDALIEGLERNQEFFTLLLNDEEIKREILGIFTEEIYNSLKKAEEEEEEILLQLNIIFF